MGQKELEKPKGPAQETEEKAKRILSVVPKLKSEDFMKIPIDSRSFWRNEGKWDNISEKDRAKWVMATEKEADKAWNIGNFLDHMDESAFSNMKRQVKEDYNGDFRKYEADLKEKFKKDFAASCFESRANDRKSRDSIVEGATQVDFGKLFFSKI